MTSETRNSVPLSEMPIEDLATLARQRINQVQLSLAEEDRKVDKSAPPVKRAISLLEFLNDRVLSVPEISAYFKRTIRKVTLARGMRFNLWDNIHIRRGEVRFGMDTFFGFSTENLPEEMSLKDDPHYLLTPELIAALYDQNKERTLIRNLARMSRLGLLRKVQSSIH